MIAIVTDSTADIPPALAQKHRIHIVPALLVIDGQAYEDGKGLSRREFYKQLPRMTNPPTTAAPSSGTFRALYEEIFARGAEHIVSIHPPSRLTALYNIASLAARPFENRVHVIDGQQLTLGLGFQALAAAQAASEGATLSQVLERIQDIRSRIRLFAMLDSLEYLRRSGRVSFLRATMGAVLRLRLLIELRGGEVIPVARVRTRKKAIARLGELMRLQGAFERFAMLHTNAEEDARQFLNRYPPPAPSKPLFINVTTVIGTHVGPNALGFVGVLSRPMVK